jgi:glycosyltransferase involved in cell wall biosynthesis
MRILFIDHTTSYHTIDKLAHALNREPDTVLLNKSYSEGMEEGFDVVWVDHLAENAVKASHLCKKPLFIRLSAMELYKRDMNAFNWKNVTGFVVQGQHLKDYYIERGFPLPANRIHVIQGCIDTDRFHLRTGNDNNRIALVSDIHWRKGIQLIPEVLEAIPKEYEIDHIGGVTNWDCKNYLEYKLRQNDLTDRYHHHGWFKHTEKFLNDRSYILSLSYTEGSPRAVGEAVSMGLVPLIHNYRGASEQFPYAYIWEDTDKLVGALFNHSMIREDEDREFYREFAVNRLSHDTIADKVKQIINTQ